MQTPVFHGTFSTALSSSPLPIPVSKSPALLSVCGVTAMAQWQQVLVIEPLLYARRDSEHLTNEAGFFPTNSKDVKIASPRLVEKPEYSVRLTAGRYRATFPNRLEDSRASLLVQSSP